MKKQSNKENYFISKNFILGLFLAIFFCTNSLKAMEESTDTGKMTRKKFKTPVSSDFFTEELRGKMRNIALKDSSKNNTESKEKLINPRELEIIIELQKYTDRKKSSTIDHHKEVKRYIQSNFEIWTRHDSHAAGAVKKDELSRLYNCSSQHQTEPHILWNKKFVNFSNHSGKYHSVPWNNCPLCIWSCVLTSEEVEGKYDKMVLTEEKAFALQVATLFEEQVNSIRLSHEGALQQSGDTWALDKDDYKIIRENKGKHAIWTRTFNTPELIPNLKISWKDCSTCQDQGIYVCENFLNTMIKEKTHKK